MTTAHDILARAGLRASSDLAFALERAAELAARMLDAERGIVWLAEAKTEWLAGATCFESSTRARTWGRLQLETARAISGPLPETLIVAKLVRSGRLVGAIGAERSRPWTPTEREMLETLADVAQASIDQAALIGACEVRSELVQATRDAQSALGRLAAMLVHDLNSITATLALTADNLCVMEDAPAWLADRAKDLDQLVAEHRPIAEQLRELSRGRVLEPVDVGAVFAHLAPLLAAMPRKIELVERAEAVWISGVRREVEEIVVAQLLAVCDGLPREGSVTVRIGPTLVIETGHGTTELVLGAAIQAATSARDTGTKKPV